MERRTTITIYGDDMCTHFWQRCHDSLHRSSLYRSIACQSNVKVLSCQNTGDQSGRSSAVTTIEDINWFAQTMKTFSMDQDLRIQIFYVDSKLSESFVLSMGMPILRKHPIVERQSAPSRKCVISVVPCDSEPNITARWEMDLSPGTDIVPWRWFFLLICMFFISFHILYSSNPVKGWWLR